MAFLGVNGIQFSDGMNRQKTTRHHVKGSMRYCLTFSSNVVSKLRDKLTDIITVYLCL